MGTGGAESMYLDGYPSSSPGKLNPPSFPPISHLSTPLPLPCTDLSQQRPQCRVVGEHLRGK